MNTTSLKKSNDDATSTRRVAAQRTGRSIPIGIAIAACMALIFSGIFSADGSFTMAPVALKRFGTENMTFLNTLIAGAFIGGTFGGASVFFDIKDWAMSKSFVVHFLTTMPVLFFFVWFEGWYGDDQRNLASALIAALMIYLVTYVMTFIVGRHKIKEVNIQL